MSEGKIPKGPWTRSGHEENFGGDVFVYGADRRALARIYSPFADDGSDTRIAVADMMLAAPELYEALRRLDAFWTECHPAGPDYPMMSRGENLSAETVSIWKAARNALLKASGGSDV